MNAIANIEAAGLDKLRLPFPAHQISKLPKESKAQADARKTDRNNAVNCQVCGGWHHKNAVHLDYVGHAALTDRLLDTDPNWTWEPAALDAGGLPAFDRTGGLWIKLTVLGVTRLGYGAADGKSGGDAVKEIIGDALRNAAMRFGAALDLWHKGDLHLDDEPEGEAAGNGDDSAKPKAKEERIVHITDQQRSEIIALATAKGIDAKTLCKRAGDIPGLNRMPAADFEKCKAWIAKQPAKPAQSGPQSHRGDVLDDEIPY